MALTLIPHYLIFTYIIYNAFHTIHLTLILFSLYAKHSSVNQMTSFHMKRNRTNSIEQKMQNSHTMVNPQISKTKLFLNIKFSLALFLVAIKSWRRLNHNLNKSRCKNIKVIYICKITRLKISC